MAAYFSDQESGRCVPVMKPVPPSGTPLCPPDDRPRDTPLRLKFILIYLELRQAILVHDVFPSARRASAK
jgi:hypothetical protein